MTFKKEKKNKINFQTIKLILSQKEFIWTKKLIKLLTFSLVVFGTSNTAKALLVNELLGQTVLPIPADKLDTNAASNDDKDWRVVHFRVLFFFLNQKDYYLTHITLMNE